MKRFYLTLILLCSSVIAIQAEAAMGDMQGKAGMGNAKNTGAGLAAKAQIFRGQGKINSVNLEAGTTNVAMGPVKALGWPSMSMNFDVPDKKLLNSLKTGESVSFDFAKSAAGGYAITRITPVAP